MIASIQSLSGDSVTGWAISASLVSAVPRSRNRLRITYMTPPAANQLILKINASRSVWIKKPIKTIASPAFKTIPKIGGIGYYGIS